MPMTIASRVVATHLLVAAYAVLGSSATQQPGCFARLFSFGDSIIDNGNWLRYFASSPGAVASSPYGETFFRRPTGRFCDGRVIIDHIADALGIPFLPPYLAGNSSRDYANGTNFAVGGATALGRHYFAARSIDDGFIPFSLQEQMARFKNVTRKLSSDSEQELNDLMSSSLFLVGEIGGNDYNRALFRGKSVDEVSNYVADVVAVISTSVSDLIGLGAKTIVVPGNFPIGCSPGYLTKFQTNDTAQYDPRGCLKWANNLSELHNSALTAALAHLRLRHPDVAVVYADYYAAVTNLIADPGEHGFGGWPLVACCGGGGPYNVNFAAQCGAKGSTACSDPYRALSWDGFHFTDHAYKVVADGVLHGPYAVPPILSFCGI